MKASEILRRAKELIGRPEKWAKCAASGEQHCAVLAMYEHVETDDGIKALQTFIVATGKSTIGEVFKWNDSPQTTHSEVMAAFDRAIALAEADERSNEPQLVQKVRESDDAYTRRILLSITTSPLVETHEPAKVK